MSQNEPDEDRWVITAQNSNRKLFWSNEETDWFPILSMATRFSERDRAEYRAQNLGWFPDINGEWDFAWEKVR